VALFPSLALLLRQHKAEQETQQFLLGKRLDEGSLVFAYVSGDPFDPSVVPYAFNRVIRKAGLPHTRFHDLRHTHATLMLKGGVHPEVVQERLGHANIGITLDLYSHVLLGLQEAAAERFDKMLEQDVSKMLAIGES